MKDWFRKSFVDFCNRGLVTSDDINYLTPAEFVSTILDLALEEENKVQHHDLKIWPQYYSHVVAGKKTFEFRENDRGYQPGDTVTLKEFDPDYMRMDKKVGKFTGYEVTFKVGYVMPIGIQATHVVFSLLPVNE